MKGFFKPKRLIALETGGLLASALAVSVAAGSLLFESMPFVFPTQFQFFSLVGSVPARGASQKIGDLYNNWGITIGEVRRTDDRLVGLVLFILLVSVLVGGIAVVIWFVLLVRAFILLGPALLMACRESAKGLAIL
jgi:hypothetical protein